MCHSAAGRRSACDARVPRLRLEGGGGSQTFAFHFALDTPNTDRRSSMCTHQSRGVPAPGNPRGWRPPRATQESAMGFFSDILNKLGIGSAPAAPAPASPTAAAPAPASPAAAPAPAPVPMVDVVAQLEQRAAANPQKLNWRTSIVDLLKLLDIDSSFARAQGTRHRAGLPAGADERFGEDEHLAAQDRARAHRCQRRQCSQRTPRLSRQRVAGGDRCRGSDPGNSRQIQETSVV